MKREISFQQIIEIIVLKSYVKNLFNVYHNPNCKSKPAIGLIATPVYMMVKIEYFYF